MADSDDGTSAPPATIGSLALSSATKLGCFALIAGWLVIGVIGGVIVAFSNAPMAGSSGPVYGVQAGLLVVGMSVFMAGMNLVLFVLGAFIVVSIPPIARLPLRILRRRTPDKF